MQQELANEEVTILHIASHGQFASKVKDTFILAFDDKLTMNHLDQLIGLFKFRKAPLELLTLSACETAVGNDQAALGLAGVAIKAGAKSAVATLWFINDNASSALITEFYRQLQDPSMSKATALQAAQQHLLTHPNSIYHHPYFWAAFVLINNWL
jgi:CHAT domain-containing protein